jgi:hypothetical protein
MGLDFTDTDLLALGEEANAVSLEALQDNKAASVSSASIGYHRSS